jgi:hypothetical protein
MKLSTEQQARYARILKDRERHNDQTVDEFCRIQGITPWIYYYWKRRLAGTPARAVASLPEKGFLPVRILPSSSIVGNVEPAITYEMEFPNGIRLRLSGALQVADHSAVIGAVGGVRP